MTNATEQTKVSLGDAMKALRDARTGLEAQLTEVRRKLKGIESEVSALWAMPLKLEDFSEVLKQHIHERGKAFSPRFGANLTRSFRGDVAHNVRPWSGFQDEDGNVLGLYFDDAPLFVPGIGQGNFGDALCFMLPDVVHQKLMERIHENAGQRWGNEDMPSMADRRKLLAQLASQREALEGEEAKLEAELADLNAAAKG